MAYTPWTGEINWLGELESESSATATATPNLTVIPLDTSPNQTFEVSVRVDGVNRSFRLRLWYDWFGDCWHITVTNPANGVDYLSGIPLIAGAYPAMNMISQYAYLGIGSLYIVPTAEVVRDWPGVDDLGTDFVLVWGDSE